MSPVQLMIKYSHIKCWMNAFVGETIKIMYIYMYIYTHKMHIGVIFHQYVKAPFLN